MIRWAQAFFAALTPEDWICLKMVILLAFGFFVLFYLGGLLALYCIRRLGG